MVALVVAVCFLAAVPTQARAGLFGSFSAEDERKLSEKFLVMVRERFEVNDDPAVNAYINAIGARLAAQVDYKVFPYHFYVINNETLNAFAAPGGHVFVFSGLINRLSNEDELASIMAHEISHVACRHLAKQMDRSSKITLATLALALAGAFLGGGGAATEAATMGSLAAGATLSLKYSRADEEEADRMGLRILCKSSYDGDEAAAALRTIYRFRWYGSDEIPTYLSTHPDMGERIGYIEDMLLANAGTCTQHTPADPTAFKKVQTRLQAVTGDPKLCLARAEGAVKERPGDFLAYYGLGLTQRRLERSTEAQAAFQQALKLRPKDPDILRDLGVSYFEAGKMADALGALKQAQTIRPDDAATIYYLGRASQEAGDINSALANYNRLVGAGLESYELYQHLGAAYAKKGDMAAGHYYSGLAFRMRGDLKNAVFHLSAALPLYKGRPEEQKVRDALKEAQDDLGNAPKEQRKEQDKDKGKGKGFVRLPQGMM